jgi:NAD(P)-dependent dehydrogenase (short-subunit alcohol dehydrogenase family)
MTSLSGKTAIITGAARGIGRASAMALAKAGADLMLLDVAGPVSGVPYPLGTRSQLASTAEACLVDGANVLTRHADVRDLHAVTAAVNDCTERFGSIDILVNNAGIAAPAGTPVHEMDEDDWSLMIDTDLSGPWRLVKAAGAVMIEQRSGSIINIASTAGLVGYRHFAAYTAAKHGVIGLTKAAALDFGPHKVRVNAICPGSVRDDPHLEGRMLSEIARALQVPQDEHVEVFLRDQPMNALVEAEDVAEAVTWLASDASVRVTGSVMTVDGGFTAR